MLSVTFIQAFYWYIVLFYSVTVASFEENGVLAALEYFRIQCFSTSLTSKQITYGISVFVPLTKS